MTAEERKAFVRRQIDELWNRGNLDAAEECFTEDFVSHDPSSPEEVRGPEGFKQSVAEVRAAFPDFRMEIVDQVAEGEKVVTRYVTTGTQEGELAGIPPTGNRVEVAGMGIDYFRGGKIRESWEYYDVMGLMRQMGVATVPGPRLLVRVLVDQAKKSRSRVSSARRRRK
jgi:steroid delta-isomerase-like uncharacterized protein